MRVDADDFGRPCGFGAEHHIEIKEILIEAGAAEKLEEEMSDGYLKEYISPLLLCDTNTCKATEEIMEGIFDRCQVLVLDAEGLRADNLAVEIVENNMEEDIDLILAVGSGTIHDISRYVAHKYRIPFISVPTAASADGFVSTEAVMTWDGKEQSIPASAPMYVFADTNIFANAPESLTASGVSVLTEKYDGHSERQLSEAEEKAVKAARGCVRGIADGDEEAYEKLMYALLLSGLAMQTERVDKVGK